MKFGIHAGLWMDRWTQDPAPLFDRAAALGFDAVELSLLGIGPEQAARLRQAAADAGGVGPGFIELGLDTGAGQEHRGDRTCDAGADDQSFTGTSRHALLHASVWGRKDQLLIILVDKISSQ